MSKKVEFTMRVDVDIYDFICSAARRRRKTNAEWLRDLLQKEVDKHEESKPRT